MTEVADIVFCEREKTNKKINVKIVCNTEMQELNKKFRNQDKNTWNKECSEEEKETVVLPINEYDVIIAGEKWENTDQCIASQASITARENKDKSQSDMIRTQNKIINTG